MIISENAELSRLIIDHLSNLYGIREKREGIHLSTLIYCLTRSYFDNCSTTPIVPTDEEVMLFALGWGLQDVLTPKGTSSPVLEKDGIMYSPDFIFQLADWRVELKTTRMSAKKGDERNFPETWIEYMKSGCFITKTNTYDLSVLFMMGHYAPPFPKIASYHFEFSDDELFANWEYILSRKQVYDEAIANNAPPDPFKYCKLDWECKNCRYKLVCESIKVAEET
jgi:hypothetical protein